MEYGYDDSSQHRLTQPHFQDRRAPDRRYRRLLRALGGQALHPIGR